MNRQSFVSFLKEPVQLQRENIPQIEKLVTDFAYCSSIHILLLVNYFKENHIKYDQQLKKAAIYASDRNILRKHVDSISESLKKPKDLPDEYTGQEAEKPGAEKEPTPGTESNSVDEALKGLNLQAYSIEESTDLTAEEQRILKIKKIIESRLQEIQREKQKRGEKPAEMEAEQPAAKEKNLDKHMDLIDKFIQEEPSIKPKQHFYDPVESADHSVVDEQNIVSETLAKIYYDQGLLHKSIKIYEKLGLKFPEKSSYFAGQIRKLKEEINQLKKK